MSRRPHALPRMPARLTWPAALALAFALLCAQVLGSLHSLQHGTGLPAGTHQALLVAAGDSVSPAATSPLAKLWSHAAGQVDCQLLDHLLHADLLPQAVLVLAPDAPQPPLLATQAVAVHPARPAWPYQARAPPSLA